MADKRIRVACRVRPRIDKFGERYEAEIFKKIDEGTLAITSIPGEGVKQQTFSFDHVFDSNDSQREIYESAVQEIIDSALDGCNSTIFAYGQTGTGKTFTVIGEVSEASETLVTPQSGLFMRSLNDLFLYKQRCEISRQADVTLVLSVVEIYNEEVRDLLSAKSKDKLQVRDNGEDVTLVDLKVEVISTMKEVYKLFQYAQSKRSVMATGMNDVSSRSHCLFMIDIHQTFADDRKKKSRLVLCDLAGSEKVKKSQVEGLAMKEAQAINVSLTCLGTVVNAMYRQQPYIPFRNSNLTRLLRPSMTDPTSIVLLITNLSPIVKSHSESLSSIRFANQVKGMKAKDAPIDTEGEQEYLDKLRELEDLCCEMRIACVSSDTKLSRNYAIEIPELSSLRGEEKVSFAAKRISGAMKEQEKQAAAKDEKLLQELIQELTQTALAEWGRRVATAEKDAIAAEAERAELIGSLDSWDATAKSDCARATAEHEAAAHVKDSAGKAVEEARHLLGEVKIYNSDVSERLAAAMEEEEKDFETAAAKKNVSEMAAIVESDRAAAEKITSLVGHSLGLLHQMIHTSKIAHSLVPLAQRLGFEHVMEEDCRSIVQDVIGMALNEKKRVMESPKFLTPTDRLFDQNKPNLVLTETSLDRLYRISFVDSPASLKRTVEYLKQGSFLLKNRWRGPPRHRRFWISQDESFLCWVDPSVKSADVKRRPLSMVTHVMMGVSREASRLQVDRTGEREVTSFSLIVRRGRALHLMCMCMEEFEAWVLGLCTLIQKSPQWYQSARPPANPNPNVASVLSKEERALLHMNRMSPELYLSVETEIRKNAGCLTKKFAEACVKTNIQVNDQGAMHLTRGQVRAIFGLDLFRSSVLWSLLRHRGVVYDMNAKPSAARASHTSQPSEHAKHIARTQPAQLVQPSEVGNSQPTTIKIPQPSHIAIQDQGVF